MKLVHISDIHIHSEEILESEPVGMFAKVLAHIENHHLDADKIIITGDLTHHGHQDDYKKLRKMIEASGLRGRLAPELLLGNHDNRDEFCRIFPESNRDSNGFVQSVEMTSAGLFIYLDTTEPGTHAGHFCHNRQEWLKQQLSQARETGQSVYIFMHHNPILVQVRNSDRIGLVQMEAFQNILASNNDLIRHIFFGHCHYSLSGCIKGVPFSAPRSTNHPCWPDLSGTEERMGYGPFERNYNVCFLTPDSTLVHSIDFERQEDVLWHLTDESGWIEEVSAA